MNVAGAPTISRPIEVRSEQVAQGVFAVEFGDGTKGYMVDGTAELWKVSGAEME